MKKTLLLILIIVFTLTGCETLKTIAQHPEYDALDLLRGRASKSYTSNTAFPEKGYRLRGVHYTNVELHKFTDNDTLYYIKYNPGREERNFYFTVIDKATKDSLLVNSLDKKKTPVVYKREQYLDDALIDLGIKDYANIKGLWTHFVPKNKWVKGDRPTDMVKMGYHKEYEVFNYAAAKKAYHEQRHPEEKITGAEVLGALIIINMLSKSRNNNTTSKTLFDSLSPAQKAVIHDHNNGR